MVYVLLDAAPACCNRIRRVRWERENPLRQVLNMHIGVCVSNIRKKVITGRMRFYYYYNYKKFSTHIHVITTSKDKRKNQFEEVCFPFRGVGTTICGVRVFSKLRESSASSSLRKQKLVKGRKESIRFREIPLDVYPATSDFDIVLSWKTDDVRECVEFRWILSTILGQTETGCRLRICINKLCR